MRLVESEPPPVEGEAELAIPHVLAWGDPAEAALIWERIERSEVARLLDASPETAARWASQPELLLRLAELSLSARSPISPVPGEAHLSFRWVLTHEADVASLLSGRDVVLDHVSLHLGESEAQELVRILTTCVGLIEIERPASIPTPGYWLACGDARLHLSTRERRPDETGFPGTAPNHLCFAVTDLDAVRLALDTAGVTTAQAGSLGNQLWMKTSEGTVVEFQRRRR